MRFKSFQSRVVVLFLGLLAVVQAAGFLAVSAAMSRSARAQVRDDLEVGGKVFKRLIGTRTEHLAEFTHGLCALPVLQRVDRRHRRA